ncbi:FTR1 family protein [Magnetospirillum sp. SS-4]|uniref:FTR1 family iron permease n=1 Tax=Magnetospirillum sp. SS-4 TaxID=2681465 RepID=UPI0013859E8C|nr:FTR1 family protein [Magnetospirillum sp. SS-4]CAA7625924.1 High-affinity Fe2+/Pb2+ permease [Magnetospirillum sp. SS-4]
MTRRLLLALGLIVAALPALAAEPVDMKAVSHELVVKGDALVAGYDPGDGAAVGDGFSDLYFDVFEESGMEQAIGMVAPATKSELESLFGEVIGKAGKGRPKTEVETAWQTLRGRLQATTAEHAEVRTGPLATFMQSFLILLREGFEAMLVVTALVAYLRRAGQSDKVKVVWHGVGWALAASLAAAWLLTQVLDISGQGQEVIEGAVMLVAAAVLFYVSFWLLSKREAARWQHYVKSQVDAAARSGRLWTLGLAAFLAVFREGAETVLFYQALALSSPGQAPALAAGMAAGALALAVLYVAMRMLSFRLPIGLFFSATAALLFLLAFTFAGKGVLELQEGRMIPITPIDWLPRVEWLGIFPTVESVGAQLALLVPMATAVLWLSMRRGAARAS